MLFKDYFTEDKVNELKQFIQTEYWITTNTKLFDMFFNKVKIALKRCNLLELLYDDNDVIEIEFIDSIVNVLDTHWLYLNKLYSLINMDINSVDNLTLKTGIVSNTTREATGSMQNNDTGQNNRNESFGYKGFDSSNQDNTFNKNTETSNYENNRNVTNNNNETQSLTNTTTRQNLDQYITLFNSTMKELNSIIYSELSQRLGVLIINGRINS